MKQIPLAKGRGFALVDDADFEWLSGYRWRLGHNGYVVRSEWQSDLPKPMSYRFSMHRQILNAQPGQYVDHIDGNPLNNTRANLRLCNAQQNTRNRAPERSATSKYKGVCWNRNAGKWQACITVDRKLRYLGLYANEEEAARVYDAQAKALFGEFARLNFPEEAAV